MRKLIIWLLLIFVWLSGFMSAKALADTVVSLVTMDNTTVTTKQSYSINAIKPTAGSHATSSANWDDVATIEDVEINNPIADAYCFDNVANFKSRAERFAQIDRCLEK